MKRLLITLLLSLLAVAAVVLWRSSPVLFPSASVSHLYRSYEHNPHIRATEIHDFRVGSADNDTITVDVTTLQADSDSAWYALLLDFGASEELIEIYKSDKQFFAAEGRHSRMVFYIDINNPKQRMRYDEPDSRVVIGALAKRSLCVFMTADTQFKEIIFYNELDKITHHEQNN